MTTVDRLPPSAINDLSRQHRPLAAELSEALLGVLDSGWYVLGANVVTFEQAFADYCGVPFAVGVANGTDALELALAAVGVGPGDPVALAANAGGYGTTAVRALGAIPVYVDVDADTACLDPDALARVLRERPVRAVLATHLYGRLAPMAEISRLAWTYGAKLVEDCAQAHGATPRRPAGRGVGRCRRVQLLSDQEPGRARRRRGGGHQRPGGGAAGDHDAPVRVGAASTGR